MRVTSQFCMLAHSTDFVICQMSLHMTYGFLLLFAFVWAFSYQIWFVNVDLYYLQLFTIIAYHLNAHIMLLRYTICNYIWHMGSQNYELLCYYDSCFKFQWYSFMYSMLNFTLNSNRSNRWFTRPTAPHSDQQWILFDFEKYIRWTGGKKFVNM